MNAIQQLAKSVLERTTGDDVAQAIKEAMTQVLATPALQQAVIEWAVKTIIEAEWRNGRQARWHGPSDHSELSEAPREIPAFGGGMTVPSEALVASINRAVAEARRRLMEYEMEPGKRLGKCVKPELLKFAVRLEKQAHTENMRAAWFRAIAGMLPDSKQPVEVVLREADLQRLKRRAMRQTEAA